MPEGVLITDSLSAPDGSPSCDQVVPLGYRVVVAVATLRIDGPAVREVCIVGF